MNKTEINNSSDGFMWTPLGGFCTGVPTIGVVHPPTSQGAFATNEIFDVIVIGAGYAGLVAGRDLATQGKKTLLLEARDRLGGRTWNATIDGFQYELGGTWLHWHMPHIYREISLYGLQNDWVVTQNPGSVADYCTLSTGHFQRNLEHKEEQEMFGHVWSLFCNVDGEYQRKSWKYAFGTGQSPDPMAKWDQLSCQDRFDQIKDQLTIEEQTMLVALLQQMGGSSLESMGLLDALRWWTLGGHLPTGMNDIALHTRLGSGNSALHRRIFDHALSTTNLSYSFSTPVTHIHEEDGIVTVTSRAGVAWRARAVVCTVPLNVLSSISFWPPLAPEKVDAFQQGSVNRGNKIHVDVKGSNYLSWSSFASPGRGLVCMFGDRLTPAGSSHLVAFGPRSDSENGIKLDDLERVNKAVLELLPADQRSTTIIERIVGHDWNKDEFARGSWCYFPPKLTTDKLEALQLPHGNVFFASADWSDGWRGWVDGAVQIGMQVAHQVCQLQSNMPKFTIHENSASSESEQI